MLCPALAQASFQCVPEFQAAALSTGAAPWATFFPAARPLLTVGSAVYSVYGQPTMHAGLPLTVSPAPTPIFRDSSFAPGSEQSPVCV